MAKVNNVQNALDTSWKSLHRDTFWGQFLQDLESSATENDRAGIVNKYNELQRRHRRLRTSHQPEANGLWGKVVGEPGVGGLQDYVRTNFDFINKNIGNNWNSYSPDSENPTSKDSPEGGWTVDSLWGGVTDHRFALGRRIGDQDDWDPEELARNNETLSKYGLKMELEYEPGNSNIGYYVIKPLGNKVAGGDPPEEVDFPPAKKSIFDRWTDWLPLTQLKAIGDWANQKSLNIKSRLTTALEEPIIKQYKVTDNYFTTSALQQKGAEALGNSIRGLSSNLDWNETKRQKAQEIADTYFLKSVEARQNKYNTDITKAQEVANTNTANRVTTRNENADRLAALKKYLLNLKDEALKTWAKNTQSYIGNMYTSAGEFVKAMRYNNLVRENAAAKRQYSNDLLGINKWVQQQTAGLFTNDQNKQSIINLLQEQLNQTENEEQRQEINYIIANYDVLASSESGRANIENALAQDIRGRAWLERVQEQVARGADNMALAAAARRDATIDENSNIKLTNQHYPWSPEFWHYSRSSSLAAPFRSNYFKSGGKVIDHTKHRESLYQREQESVRKSQDAVNKDLMSNLHKEISQLKREELQLLRTIFK